jgi:hypothetical protein
MNRIILIILLLVSVSALLAEVDGSKGFQMLRILVDPVTAAQGGNGSINSVSGYNFLDNAAAPLRQNGKNISFSQNFWLFDTSMSSIGYHNNSGNTSIGIAMRYLDYGKIDNRDETGEIIGEYHPMDFSVSFNMGVRLASAHYLGTNINGLYEKIDDSSSTGISFDLGYIYLTPLKNLNLMATAKNLGFTSNMDAQNIELPITFDLSISKIFLPSYNPITAEMKLIKEIDNDNLKAAFGAEVNIYENFYLRAGYKLGSDLEGISGGFGVRADRFMIDYSYNPISEGLDDVHLLGISCRL